MTIVSLKYIMIM